MDRVLGSWLGCLRATILYSEGCAYHLRLGYVEVT